MFIRACLFIFLFFALSVAVSMMLGTSQAHALTCEKNFSSPSISLQQIQQLAEILLQANKDQIAQEDFVFKRPYKISHAEDTSMNYRGEFKIYRIFIDTETYQTHIDIRSNGRIAFLDKSFRNRDFGKSQAKKYWAASVDPKGSLKTLDQGDLLLHAMPENITLGRSMAENLRQNWFIDNALDTMPRFRLHFAYGYYKFKDTEPYFFKFTKKELLDLYAQGGLEINTYDALGTYAMTSMAHNSLGIEFELVFIGNKAFELIQQRMQDGLRQRILPF